MLKIDLQDVLTIKEEILSDLEDIDDLFKIIIFNLILLWMVTIILVFDKIFLIMWIKMFDFKNLNFFFHYNNKIV